MRDAKSLRLAMMCLTVLLMSYRGIRIQITHTDNREDKPREIVREAIPCPEIPEEEPIKLKKRDWPSGKW